MMGRLGGRPVGVIGHDPKFIGGGIDAAAAQKLERFIDVCDTFNLPIVDMFDVPGFMVGISAEEQGTLKHGVRMIFAIEETVVPWASVLVRRIYGVAGVGHRPHNRYTYRVGWPSGEWGGLPIEGGVDAAYRREIEAADDPDEYRRRLEAEFVAVRSPFRVAETLGVEDIIDPRDTRPLLCEWAEMAYQQLPAILGRKVRGARP
jgi:acetyl-CoA carboxylase carboxyltransferase component